MTARYRVGIIGCGGIARSHLRGYRDIPGAEVVAGADPLREARERWEKEHGVAHMYASAQEMLDHEPLDIVSLCVWPPIRPELTELVCARGVKGIVAEKPMAVDLAGCDRMIAAAERAGRHLTVIHNRRFDSAARAMKELVDSGDLGEPFLVETHGIEGPNTVSRGPWLASRAEGGIAMAQTVHFAYMVRWLLGPVTEVTCFTSRKGIDWMQGEVSCIILLRFAGDAIGELTSTFAAAAGKNEHRITIYGDRGIVSHARDELRVVCPTRYGDDEWHTITAGEGNWGEGFRHQIVQFGRAIAGEGEVAVPPEEGRAAVEIIAAAYRSAAERRVIRLPLTE